MVKVALVAVMPVALRLPWTEALASVVEPKVEEPDEKIFPAVRRPVMLEVAAMNAVTVAFVMVALVATRLRVLVVVAFVVEAFRVVKLAVVPQMVQMMAVVI